MVTLVKKITTITEFGNNLEVKIEGLLSNGDTMGVKHTYEAMTTKEPMMIIMNHEKTKINCEEYFQKELEKNLKKLNPDNDQNPL